MDIGLAALKKLREEISKITLEEYENLLEESKSFNPKPHYFLEINRTHISVSLEYSSEVRRSLIGKSIYQICAESDNSFQVTQKNELSINVEGQNLYPANEVSIGEAS